MGKEGLIMFLPSSILHCENTVSPATLSAIIKVESGYHRYAMYNNTLGKSFIVHSKIAAIALLTHFIQNGDQVDVGLGQVDTENFKYYHLTPSNAFNTCTNLEAASNILTKDYIQTSRVYSTAQVALYHAFEMYNSGNMNYDSSYANKIFNAAHTPVFFNNVIYHQDKITVQHSLVSRWKNVSLTTWRMY